jgi:tRNA-Thr(GGU) m(6)t(6)A37 methyltransferase TsaA
LASEKTTPFTFVPIGTVHHNHSTQKIPKHWSESDLEGELELMPEYREGLSDIRPGQQIAVLFCFHQSPGFGDAHLRQKRRGSGPVKGVFSLFSPIRPNPIGHSVLTVLWADGCRIGVKSLDMLDGTPILDIKPHVRSKQKRVLQQSD